MVVVVRAGRGGGRGNDDGDDDCPGLLSGVAEPLSSMYMDSVKGRCADVPSGVVVEVFYTKAGQSQRTPLYMIVGAKIT